MRLSARDATVGPVTGDGWGVILALPLGRIAGQNGWLRRGGGPGEERRKALFEQSVYEKGGF